MAEDSILELDCITKIYPGVVALDNVSLKFKAGTIHAIVGENGAGKSTFIKVITGAIQQDQGELFFFGEHIKHNTPEKAIELGISAIYQELNLLPHLSVAENIYYNRYKTHFGLINFRELEERASKVIDRLGVCIDPGTLVKDLSIGYQQLVEIAKSLSKNVKVLIMDEPSATLTNTELEHVFRIVKVLKQEGVAIIYISHRLEEIFDICDMVSVFRDGRLIKTCPVSETDKTSLIRDMVNRPLSESFPKVDLVKGEKVLEVKNLCTTLLENVSFSAFRGERLGFAGLIGAGRTEVVRAIFGADPIGSGEVWLNGKKLSIRQPVDAIKNGIALIPEDRKGQGALLHMSVCENISIVKLKSFSIPGGFILQNKEKKSIDTYINDLRIKTPTSLQLVKNLSGGNQQKVVLAKWLLVNSDVIVFDEPTRGIDVGAKQEIYALINTLAMAGKVIILISSEMPELLGMSDRILVMAEGRVTGELNTKDATQEEIMHLSAL